MSEIIKILKNIALITIIVLMLSGLGTLINNAIGIGWNYLIDFFSIIKRAVNIIDFMWDTTTLWTLVGIQLLIQVILITYEATLTIINRFSRK